MPGNGRYCCDRMIHPEPNEKEIKNKREHQIGFAIHHLDRMIGRASHMRANEKGIDDNVHGGRHIGRPGAVTYLLLCRGGNRNFPPLRKALRQ